MTHLASRIDRLADRLRPAGCAPAGRSCADAWWIRGDEDPALNPPPPATCPHCDRPRLVREIELTGVDARLL